MLINLFKTMYTGDYFVVIVHSIADVTLINDGFQVP